MGNIDNVATLSLSPGYNNLTVFCAESGMGNIDESYPICHNNVISYDNRPHVFLDNDHMENYEYHHAYDLHD